MNWGIIFKGVEFILAFACIMLWEFVGIFSSVYMFVCGVLMAFTVLAGAYLVVEFVDIDPNLLISGAGAVLFVVSGIMVFLDQVGSQVDYLVNGIFLCINGALFIFEFIMFLTH